MSEPEANNVTQTEGPAYSLSTVSPLSGNRVFSAMRKRTIDVEKVERRHREYVRRVLLRNEKNEDKEERAYVRLHTHCRIIPGMGKRMKDEGVIEYIMDSRNRRWRNQVEAGKGTEHISVPIIRRKQLPRENPKRWRQKANHVFYWG